MTDCLILRATLTLWLWSFFATFQGHNNFLQTLTWHGLSFSMFTVWHEHFSLVLVFSGLRIEALPLHPRTG